MKKARGERNWKEVVGDYQVHTPPPRSDLEQSVPTDDDPIIWVHDKAYVRAADGKLEAL